MVEDAEQHLDHEQRLKRLEDLQSSFFYSDEWLKMVGRVETLYASVLEARMVLIETIILVRLTNISNIPDAMIKKQAKWASADILRHKEWFKGAFPNTDDPATTFSEWFQRVEKSLNKHGFEVIVEDISQLLPLPLTSED